MSLAWVLSPQRAMQEQSWLGYSTSERQNLGYMFSTHFMNFCPQSCHAPQKKHLTSVMEHEESHHYCLGPVYPVSIGKPEISFRDILSMACWCCASPCFMRPSSACLLLSYSTALINGLQTQHWFLTKENTQY